MAKKIIIVGGVAGGATAAARLRRLDEMAEIIIIERGNYVSYANCGLPYYIGGVIESRDPLLLQTPKSLKDRYNIDVRIKQEALKIDTAAKTLRVKDINNGVEYTEAYDTLVLACGSEPVKPPIPGINEAINEFKCNCPFKGPARKFEIYIASISFIETGLSFMVFSITS